MQTFYIYYTAYLQEGRRVKEIREIESQSYVTARGVAEYLASKVLKEIEDRGTQVKSLKLDDVYLDKKKPG